MSRRLVQQVFLAVLLCAVPLAAFAQQPEDPVEKARLKFGPVGLTPSISFSNLGVDSNVFNEVDNPKRDFTVTLSPELNTWFRAGRSRTHVAGRTDLVYFHTYSSERSVDGAVDGRFELSGNRVTPWVAGSFSSGRQRVGYEIDLRSRRVTKNAEVGTAFRVGGKTRIAASAARQQLRYDADALFFGSDLSQLLNRTSNLLRLEYRQALTVLTTVVGSAETQHDRFDFATDRNANSLRLQGGLDFDERALIGGTVRIGYRQLTGLSSSLPSYRGLVFSVGTSVMIKGRTRVELAGMRDVYYSFESAYPYYLQTGGTLTVTPRLTDLWDVQARVGLEHLSYRPTSLSVLPDRLDRYVLGGGGVGYRLGRSVRVGVNVDRERRSSPVQTRDYKAFRIGTSATYGR